MKPTNGEKERIGVYVCHCGSNIAMDCAACILTPKMVDAGTHPNIDLLTWSEVERVDGYVGNFSILATGFDLFDARRVPQYGYGRLANVFTSLEFERMCYSRAG